MTDLTPALSLRYRREALVALGTLVQNAQTDVADGTALAAAVPDDEQQPASAAQDLGTAEDRLALLQECQDALRSGSPKLP